MPEVFNCSCKLVPKCMIKWEVSKYVLYHPGFKIELHIPYQSLDRKVLQGDILNYWDELLHTNFCVSDPDTRRERLEEEILQHVFGVMSIWIHCDCKREVQGRSYEPRYCKIVRSMHPRE